MKVRSLDSNGDYSIGSLISDAEYVSQSILTRLKMFKGEWFLDTEAGVPWFQDILKRNPSDEYTSLLIKSEILSVDGVDRISSFNLERDNNTRKLSISFTVETSSGSVVSNSIEV